MRSRCPSVLVVVTQAAVTLPGSLSMEFKRKKKLRTHPFLRGWQASESQSEGSQQGPTLYHLLWKTG